MHYKQDLSNLIISLAIRFDDSFYLRLSSLRYHLVNVLRTRNISNVRLFLHGDVVFYIIAIYYSFYIYQYVILFENTNWIINSLLTVTKTIRIINNLRDVHIFNYTLISRLIYILHFLFYFLLLLKLISFSYINKMFVLLHTKLKFMVFELWYSLYKLF